MAPNSRRTFYTLAVTQTLSLVGSRMSSIAVGLYVFSQTGQTTPLLLAVAFQELPAIVLTGLAGVLADRYDRRLAMIVGDAGQAAASLFLLTMFASGNFQIWQLYAAGLLQGVFLTLQGPATSASITLLIPEGERERANAIQQTGFPMAGVIAPVLTGLLYPIAGVIGVISVDLATFVVAVVIVFWLRIPRPATTAEGAAMRGSVWQEFTGALRFLIERRGLLGLILYSTLANFLLNGPLELAIPYLITLTGDETLTGLLLGVMNGGALAGGVLIAVWGGTRPRVYTMISGALLVGLMLVAYGIARIPVALGGALFLMFVPLPVINTMFFSIVQLKVPPDAQGRVFAVMSQIAFVATPLSFFVTGLIVDKVVEPAVSSPGWRIFAPLVGSIPGSGMGLVMVATGTLMLVLTMAAFAMPAIRRLENLLPDYEPISEVV